jgi:hypothetical protein
MTATDTGSSGQTAHETAHASPNPQQPTPPTPVSPIFVGTANSREQAGNPAKTLGLVDGCSRVFPAVHGTRDRKRTAAAGKGDRKGWQPCTGGGVSGDGPAIGNDCARGQGAVVRTAYHSASLPPAASASERIDARLGVLVVIQRPVVAEATAGQGHLQARQLIGGDIRLRRCVYCPISVSRLSRLNDLDQDRDHS